MAFHKLLLFIRILFLIQVAWVAEGDQNETPLELPKSITKEQDYPENIFVRGKAVGMSTKCFLFAREITSLVSQRSERLGLDRPAAVLVVPVAVEPAGLPLRKQSTHTIHKTRMLIAAAAVMMTWTVALSRGLCR